jgi:hypothetical protein
VAIDSPQMIAKGAVDSACVCVQLKLKIELCLHWTDVLLASKRWRHPTTRDVIIRPRDWLVPRRHAACRASHATAHTTLHRATLSIGTVLAAVSTITTLLAVASAGAIVLHRWAVPHECRVLERHTSVNIVVENGPTVRASKRIGAGRRVVGKGAVQACEMPLVEGDSAAPVIGSPASERNVHPDE